MNSHSHPATGHDTYHGGMVCPTLLDSVGAYVTSAHFIVCAPNESFAEETPSQVGRDALGRCASFPLDPVQYLQASLRLSSGLDALLHFQVPGLGYANNYRFNSGFVSLKKASQSACVHWKPTSIVCGRLEMCKSVR